MNRDIRDRWVTALRSGNYNQGRGYLRYAYTDEYCCLGVLCELAVSEGVIDHVINGSHHVYDTSVALLPSAVMAWSGVSSDLGLYGGVGECLAVDNDNGKTFGEIADIIEEHF